MLREELLQLEYGSIVYHAKTGKRMRFLKIKLDTEPFVICRYQKHNTKIGPQNILLHKPKMK